MTHLLAQMSRDPSRVIVWVLVLIGVMIAGGVAILVLRRRLFAGDREGASHEGLFESLRRMRDRGEISPDEYDRARQKIVSRLASRPAPMPGGAAPARQGRLPPGPPASQ